MDKKCIEDFLLWLTNTRGSSPSTYNQRLCAIHAFFDYVMTEEPTYMEQCILILKIPSMVSPDPPAQYLTPENLKHLLSMPDTSTPKGRRHLVLLTVLYDTAARVSELADICMRDVRLDFPAVITLHGKGGKIRTVPLMKPTTELLRSYLEENHIDLRRNPDMPLFWNGSRHKLTRSGITYIVQKYADMARETASGMPIGKPNEYYNEELLYRMFGINAELLIDHAWGWEPCRMQDIKAYRPETNSICSGQVLQCPYSFEKARLVVREMAEAVALDLLEKKLVTDQLTLTVGYDIENTAGGSYHGETVTDRYGRKIPKHTHGTANLPRKTSSARSITDAVLGVYDTKVNPKLSIRRLTITANRLVGEDTAQQEPEAPVQFNLFDNIEVQEQRLQEEVAQLERERKIQEAMLGIKKKFGKNAI